MSQMVRILVFLSGLALWTLLTEALGVSSFVAFLLALPIALLVGLIGQRILRGWRGPRDRG